MTHTPLSYSSCFQFIFFTLYPSKYIAHSKNIGIVNLQDSRNDDSVSNLHLSVFCIVPRGRLDAAHLFVYLLEQ